MSTASLSRPSRSGHASLTPTTVYTHIATSKRRQLLTEFLA